MRRKEKVKYLRKWIRFIIDIYNAIFHSVVCVCVCLVLVRSPINCVGLPSQFSLSVNIYVFVTSLWNHTSVGFKSTQINHETTMVVNFTFELKFFFIHSKRGQYSNAEIKWNETIICMYLNCARKNNSSNCMRANACFHCTNISV